MYRLAIIIENVSSYIKRVNFAPLLFLTKILQYDTSGNLTACPQTVSSYARRSRKLPDCKNIKKDHDL